jgi:serine/threonine protein kinase
MNKSKEKTSGKGSGKRSSPKQVQFSDKAEVLFIPNERNLESGEIVQEIPIYKDEIISRVSKGDIIKLPRNQLRGPLELVIVKNIGSGAYGEVYEVKPKGPIPDYFPFDKKERKLGKEPTYALKIMKSLKKTRAFEYEQMIMNAISAAYPNYRPPCAPHVLCYFDITQDKQGRFYFLSEIMDGDTLQLWNSMKTGKENMTLAKATLKQTLAGLKELQEIGLLHRDLKHENILYHIPINSETGRKQKSKIELKLADFGLSCIPKSEKLGCGFKVTGTPGFIDPILLIKVYELKDEDEKKKLDKLDELWDETNDIYSLAVILYEMIFGRFLNSKDYDGLTLKDEDIIRIIYTETEERNTKKVIEEMKKYKEGSAEYKLLSFILRNIKSFERKQTIDEALQSLK